MKVNKVGSEYHKKYRFGIMDPSLTRGIGWVGDVVAFFDAVKLAVDEPERNYPFLWSLRRKPVFGLDMLPLFEEAQKIRLLMEDVPMTDEVLAKLHLDRENTKLKTEAATLAGVFERMFKTLAEDGPELVRLRMAKADSGILETGSIRLGPVEPLVPSSFFQKLPASAFDDADPPLWLRDEIFDQEFYAGKI
ncbi:hypothetical protein [Yoonia sp. I 8.24]|uniref:hypothetical protein n=1 Tax=Yoonia sp. I 8.24 TaxID=1537229 RepID=UPI001EDF811C|nr:hypothetical protein [Yoonia sp. I 8.24]MCG3266593.1 hypothetical protein [Yoonia sp. I 8.24]